MTVKEFIKQIKDNLDSDTNIDFLAIDTHSCEGGVFLLDKPIVSRNSGTIIFSIYTKDKRN